MRIKVFLGLVQLASARATPVRSVEPRTIDLGYGLYTGIDDNVTGLTTWKGIRYAAPPLGALRWQAPRSPATNHTAARADTFGPACPQTYPSLPGVSFMFGDEDCLFLNVYAPTVALPRAIRNDTGSNETRLPVFVSIHGGGYGLGNGMQDMSSLVNTNDNSFIAVSIQYRVRNIKRPGLAHFALRSLAHVCRR